jgi:purine-binding chemotaxis protein CheW
MNQTTLPHPAPSAELSAAAMPAERVFVTLTLADQLCGVPVEGVRDVLGEQSVTRIPLAPPEIAGSLNLRGRIVTAIDLRRRGHQPPAPPGLAGISSRDGMQGGRAGGPQTRRRAGSDRS